ncbi:uncharacterized protein LOC134822800 [Bolinopsis microptera]|uniref:uncharacterized protein LOC134822800 n=1 Tax=Bolinopsis microptera TaxID=2820187 RepID=UPI0030791DD4
MFDATGLAIPLFVCGNGLDIDTGYRKYDRIYVGAEVPQSHKRTFCSLLANRGKLVMPYMNKLICVTRDDDSFTCKELMSVSFRPLLTPQMIAEEVVGDEEPEERDPHIFQISTRIETLQEMCRFEIYQLLGREHLAKVLELPISPILQDFIVYYRDPALTHTRVRPVYNEPPPPPRSRIQAILQDPPPRIGEYLGLVERLIAERGRPDGADDSDEDLPADSDDDDMPVMMAANMEDADEDLPNLREDEVEEAFIESDDSDNSLESAEEMEEEWESGNEDIEEETVQVEEEDEEEEGNVMVIVDEAIQHQSDDRQDGNG